MCPARFLGKAHCNKHLFQIENMITVLATIISKPELVDEMKGILTEMATYSIAEEACLKFEVLQLETDSTHFVLNEQWTSKEGLTAHFKTAHFKRISPGLFASAVKHPETLIFTTV